MTRKGMGLSVAMRLAPALLAFAAPMALHAEDAPAAALTSAQSALVAKATKLGTGVETATLTRSACAIS